MVLTRQSTVNIRPPATTPFTLGNSNQIIQNRTDCHTGNHANNVSISPIVSTTNVLLPFLNNHNHHYYQHCVAVDYDKNNVTNSSCPYDMIEGCYYNPVFSNNYHCQHFYNPTFYNELTKSLNNTQPPLQNMPWKLYDNSRTSDRNWWIQKFPEGKHVCPNAEFELCAAIPRLSASTYCNNGGLMYSSPLMNNQDDSSWLKLSWRNSVMSECGENNGSTLHNTCLNTNGAPIFNYRNEEFLSPPSNPQMIFGCGTLPTGMRASVFYVRSAPQDIQGQASLALVSGQCRECTIGCLDRVGCGCRLFPGSKNAGCFFALCGATERLAHLFNGLFAS